MRQDNAFVTLTYSENDLPTCTSASSSNTWPTLNPKDLSNWLKLLRKEISPQRIRYYCVGEYGENTNRPHYHVALFGYPPCRYGRSRYSKSQLRCCVPCDTILRTWKKGQVFVGTLEPHAAQYIAGYVTKKMTKVDDPRLDGRHPEFARMSLRPGIGADAMDDVASVYLQLNLDKTEADVPVSLRHGPKLLPLGRYLRRQLRKRIGRDEATPPEVLEALQQELSSVHQAAVDVTSAPGMARLRSLVYRDMLVDASKGKVARLEARARIFKKRGNI